MHREAKSLCLGWHRAEGEPRHLDLKACDHNHHSIVLRPGPLSTLIPRSQLVSIASFKQRELADQIKENFRTKTIFIKNSKVKIIFSKVMCSKHYDCKCGGWMEEDWSHLIFEPWQKNNNKRNQVTCALWSTPSSTGRRTRLWPQLHVGCLMGLVTCPTTSRVAGMLTGSYSGPECLWASLLHRIMHHPCSYNLSKNFIRFSAEGFIYFCKGFGSDSFCYLYDRHTSSFVKGF